MAPFSFIARVLIGAYVLGSRGLALLLARDIEADVRQDRVRQSGGWGL